MYIKPFLYLSILFKIVSAKTIIIGDSMFAESPVKQHLENWCNCNIDNYAKVGASLEEGWIESIPCQYNDIKELCPTTIIMDGGGNDVMSHINECRQLTEQCKILIDNVIINIANSLITEMNNNNVHNIVYLGFYYLQNLNEVIDYGSEKILSICNNTNNCYFSDPRNISMPLGWDGVHPTSEGFELLAHNIWNTIQDNNIIL